MHHYKSCGLDNVWLKNGYQTKSTSYGDAVSIHNIDGLHKAIACSIVKKPGQLTGKEFKFLRIEMDLSQSAIGVLMEKSSQSVAKWEKGQIPLPRLADKAIRDMYLESVGDSPIAGLLSELAKIDRKIHELHIELEETERGWDCAVAA